MKIQISTVSGLVQDWIENTTKTASESKSKSKYFADLGEIQEGEIHIIAGCQGVGKTAFLLKQALSTASKEGVLFFSLDVPKNELVKRIISQESRVALSQISNNMELKSIQSYLNNKPLYIAENNCLNIFELQNTIQEFIKSNDVKLVVIDSLEGIGINPNNWKDKEILVIMRTLKQLAVDLNIAVLLSTQINKNDGKKPSLNEIENINIFKRFVHTILLIHRPEYFAIDEFDNGSNTKGKAEIMICDNNQVKKEKNVILNYDKKCLLYFK